MTVSVVVLAGIGLAVLLWARQDTTATSGDEQRTESESATANDGRGSENGLPDENQSVAAAGNTEFVLSADGIGPIAFGASEDAAIAAFADAFGDFEREPSNIDFALCPELYVTWDGLTAVFDEDQDSSDLRFSGWTYEDGEPGTAGNADGLTTRSGIGLGATGTEIESAVPSATSFEGGDVGEGIFAPPSYAADDVSLVMDQPGRSGTVVAMFTGFNGCVE